MKLETPTSSKAATPVKGNHAVGKKVFSSKKSKKTSLAGAELGINVEKLLNEFGNGHNKERNGGELEPSVKIWTPNASVAVKGSKDSTSTPLKGIKASGDLNSSPGKKQKMGSSAEKSRKKKRKSHSAATSTPGVKEKGGSDQNSLARSVLNETLPGGASPKKKGPKPAAVQYTALEFRKVLESVKALLASCSSMSGQVLIQMVVGAVSKSNTSWMQSATGKMQLKYSPYSEETRVCIIVRDPCEDSPHYWTQLKSGVGNLPSKVIAVKQLTEKYNKKKEKLCNKFDIFLVDNQIVDKAAMFFGSSLGDLNKIAFKFGTRDDLSAQRVRDALACVGRYTFMIQENSTILVGNSKLSDQDIAENIMEASKHVGRWDKIKDISIQAVGGKPFLLYNMPVDLEVLEKMKKRKATVPTTGRNEKETTGDDNSEGEEDGTDQDEAEDNNRQIKKRKGGNVDESPEKKKKISKSLKSDFKNGESQPASEKGGRGGGSALSKRRSFGGRGRGRFHPQGRVQIL